MVARVWHGWAKPEHADAYEAMLKPEPLPGLGKLKGYRGSCVLRHNAAAEVEFTTILFWDSIEAIRAVLGSNYEVAVVPEERRRYLLHYDDKATHYEVASVHQLSGFELA
jgi:antibiotic biosynthesis monooxygenase (ABM) superfamily enzyme